MDLGIHLPLMQFGDERLSFGRLEQAVDAARECGFAAVSANDHFIFSTPWLDGPTALASVIERSGDMTLATTVSLAVLRGPVPLAKTLAALDVLSEGRAGRRPGTWFVRTRLRCAGHPVRGALEAVRRGHRSAAGAARGKALSGGGALLPPALRCRARAGSSTRARHTSVDRKLGLEGRTAPGRAGGRRLACLRLQHDAGPVRRSA